MPVPLAPLDIVSARSLHLRQLHQARSRTGVIYNAHTPTVLNAKAEINVNALLYEGVSA